MAPELLAQLPPGLVAAYELDQLFSTSTSDGHVWLVRRFGEWYLGPVLGSAFADAVLGTWTMLSPGPVTDWT